MPDSTLSTLKRIRIKVRRITKSPSNSQITDDQIDEYINTFIIYDLPSRFKLNSLSKSLIFYTSPNVDKYETSTISTDPLYNFKNKYSSVHGPVYVAGREAFLSSSKEEFYGIYQKNQYKVNIGSGNGVITNFSGTLDNFPILPKSVLVSGVGADNGSLKMVDNGEGLLLVGSLPVGTIDYLTGEYDANFDGANPPVADSDVFIQFVPYTAAKPDTILYENNGFTLRPVPDGTYSVEVQGFTRPTELLTTDDIPELSQWWQLISYGAAEKIFQDRSDFEAVANILPELDKQLMLVGRRSIVQNSGRRASTIYSDGI